MKLFLSFVKKEFYHIFRDVRTMLILLGMPIAQILLFGFAISTEVRNVNVAVYNPSMDAVTQAIVERIDASEYFNVTKLLATHADINDVFKDGNVSLVIVFSDHFAGNLYAPGEAAIQLITDGTEPNQASMIANYATGIINSCRAELMQPHSQAMQIVPQVRMLYNPQGESAYNFVPSVMGMILMLICAMMTSIAIVREKETGTMEVLLASPTPPILIILAKAVPYFTLSICNITTLLTLAVFVLKVPIAGSLAGLFFVSLLFIFLALSLGLLISTMVDKQMAAMLISGMGLMMPVMLLSGMMFPIESMPKILQYLSAIVPARWYISAVKKIMIQGTDIAYAAQEIIILAVMTLLIVAVSLRKFKTRLN